ncbi:nitrilase-related carbon-nitrogen hydrolase [Pseudoclavibacter helvolus]|uniref:nitrilase-related carbon-nitrogen hydrolase n=1 Tax=Pseudoclavibacter helvolus TaxID=255205 RepID=UPI003C72010C
MALISVLQAQGTPGAVDDNLKVLRSFAERAAGEGADILVTPELFATGYAPAKVAGDDGSPIRQRVAQIAADLGIAIVASTVEHTLERSAGFAANATTARRFISASLFGADGNELTRYRKSNLFGGEEQEVFNLGDAPAEVVEIAGLRVALAICYDIEFPEIARRAAVAGAEALLIPTAVPATGDVLGDQPGHSYNAEVISTHMVPVRALENGLYIAYANHAGPGFTGLSTIASPYGNTLAIASRDDTELLSAEFSSSEVAKARNVNSYLTDLRP